MQRSNAACLKAFRKVGSMNQNRPFVCKGTEKGLDGLACWIGLLVECKGVSENNQGRANSASQIDGDLDMHINGKKY